MVLTLCIDFRPPSKYEFPAPYRRWFSSDLASFRPERWNFPSVGASGKWSIHQEVASQMHCVNRYYVKPAGLSGAATH